METIVLYPYKYRENIYRYYLIIGGIKREYRKFIMIGKVFLKYFVI